MMCPIKWSSDEWRKRVKNVKVVLPTFCPLSRGQTKQESHKGKASVLKYGNVQKGFALA